MNQPFNKMNQDNRSMNMTSDTTRAERQVLVEEKSLARVFSNLLASFDLPALEQVFIKDPKERYESESRIFSDIHDILARNGIKEHVYREKEAAGIQFYSEKEMKRMYIQGILVSKEPFGIQKRTLVQEAVNEVFAKGIDDTEAVIDLAMEKISMDYPLNKLNEREKANQRTRELNETREFLVRAGQNTEKIRFQNKINERESEENNRRIRSIREQVDYSLSDAIKELKERKEAFEKDYDLRLKALVKIEERLNKKEASLLINEKDDVLEADNNFKARKKPTKKLVTKPKPTAKAKSTKRSKTKPKVRKQGRKGM